jgi:hypothetical protein
MVPSRSFALPPRWLQVQSRRVWCVQPTPRRDNPAVMRLV